MSTEYLHPQWPAPARVGAAFTGRSGGVSRAPYNAFNLGAHVGDEAAAVAWNRALLRRELSLPSEPLWLEQVHGIEVLDADRLEAPGPVRADAALTRRPGVVLAVLVADCLPVLFAARDGSAVAVAHAGWRGLAAGVLEATVTALAGSGPLLAWLGPAIGAPHFEVGAEVRTAFLGRPDAHAPETAAAFTPNTRGRWQCDLRALARVRLLALGINAVYADASCSYGEPQRFYSHRRDGQTGRMAALIWLHAA
ncbi:MAG TPA: peptidoglycan editing factor PgeF [Steroidobacteraceae bacterium]